MKYLALIKYTPDGCAAIAKEGLGSRRAALETAVQAQGGNIDEFWALDSFDWNVCFIMSVPDDQTAGVRVAQYVVQYGLGHIENSLVIPLVSTDEADAAMKAFVAVRVPGT